MVWNKGKSGYNYIRIDEELLRKYYLDDKLTQQQCADKFGCSTKPIRDALTEYNIPRRSKSEALRGNQNCRGRIYSEETKKKISDSQSNKGTNINYNTGRTWFKKGRETTLNMKETASNMMKERWKENPNYLPNYNRELWKEDRERMMVNKPKGENHWAWNENLDFYVRARNWLKNEFNWHEKIFERDNYTCYICGYNGRLNAHHTIPLNQILYDFVIKYGEDMEKLKLYEEFTTLENGITLCEKCHKHLHWS